MKLVFVIILSIFIIFVSSRRIRKNRYRSYGNEVSNEISEYPSWNDWSVDYNWFREAFGRPRRQSNRYSKLTLERQKFYYWDSTYEDWTNWTACDPVSCLTMRNRKCKDNTWQERVMDFQVEVKCPVRYVYERKKCTDVKECRVDPKATNNKLSNFLPTTCGKRPEFIETKIYGGKESVKNSWPWHGGLYVMGRAPIYICGATLINSGWAITAAHCLKTLSSMNRVPYGVVIDTRRCGFYNKFQLVFGDHDKTDLDNSEKVTRISHFVIHPSFQADYTTNLYDIALLKLDSIIPQQRNIDFPCMPDSINYTLPKTAKCVAIGWGHVTPREQSNIWNLEIDLDLDRFTRRRQKSRDANILQEVEIPLADFEYCQQAYRIFNLQKHLHICAGTQDKDTCRGDSGGGLFCLDPSTNRWQLYGITNFGSSRGCGMSYGVYVRVAAVTTWIKETIKST